MGKGAREVWLRHDHYCKGVDKSVRRGAGMHVWSERKRSCPKHAQY